MELLEDEVLAVLHAIERGEVTIPEDQKRAAAESWGSVEFTCSNGWRFIIYNDAGAWDYIEEVVAPDGAASAPVPWTPPCPACSSTTRRVDWR
jgi:hypothetical protein